MSDLREIKQLVQKMESDIYSARDYAQVAAWLTEDDRPIPEEHIGALYRIISDCLSHTERIVETWTKIHNALPEVPR